MNSAIHVSATHRPHWVLCLQREWQLQFDKPHVSADMGDPCARCPENRRNIEGVPQESGLQTFCGAQIFSIEKDPVAHTVAPDSIRYRSDVRSRRSCPGTIAGFRNVADMCVTGVPIVCSSIA